MPKKEILVHACCATCAGYVLEKLETDFIPVIYYYNPNIYPFEEYVLRKNELERYAAQKNIRFLEEKYNPQDWQDRIRGLEKEPEKGLRCTKCFAMRLSKSASVAAEHQIKLFTTTLTISPHKDSKTILAIGREAAQKYSRDFLDVDFKKQNGFQKTMAIAKRENFYRQNYCGCLYSQKRN
jgi:predicted adenine nucleotide alpha hydrolase (AANH) superfamily ATPase